MSKPGFTIVNGTVWKTADLASMLAASYKTGTKVKALAETYDLSEEHVRNYIRAWNALSRLHRDRWQRGFISTTLAFKLAAEANKEKQR